MGPLGFAFLRMTLVGCYSQNLAWFAFWEESTELLFVVGIAFVLWTFRRDLLGKKQDVTDSRAVSSPGREA